MNGFELDIDDLELIMQRCKKRAKGGQDKLREDNRILARSISSMLRMIKRCDK